MKRTFRIGPGAPSLMLIVVILCLTALSALMLTDARNDLALSRRAAAVAQGVAELQEQAETDYMALMETVAEYGEAYTDHLPEGMTLDDGDVVWQVTVDSRTLNCRVRDGQWIERTLSTDIGAELDMPFDIF
ncbi:MAG: hypothetical protein MJ099_03190 [Clostridia bacterium]|nr:hypothetical protein [Clostridia bacterium]